MPIYEFFCEPCNTIFNFLSRRVNTEARPACPRCGGELQRRLSAFATIGKAREPADDMFPDVDEARMERVFDKLAREAENLNEEDPRQMARMMRRFTTETGLDFGGNMARALERLEAGEDPEKIEQELGDLLEGDETPFEMKKGGGSKQRPIPRRDDTLYEL